MFDDSMNTGNAATAALTAPSRAAGVQQPAPRKSEKRKAKAKAQTEN